MTNLPVSEEVFQHTLDNLSRDVQSALETAGLAPCSAVLSITDGNHVVSLKGKPDTTDTGMWWNVSITTLTEIRDQQEGQP